MASSKKFTLWPYAIIAAFVLFAVFIGQFIYQSTKYKVNLVSEDYYEQELDYQTRIEAIQRSAEFKNNFEVITNNKSVIVSLPEAIKTNSGTITFFRPSDADDDVVINWQPEMGNKLSVSKTQLSTGHWMVKAILSGESKRYYFEKELNL